MPRNRIEPAREAFDADGSLFAPRARPKPTFRHIVGATQEAIAALGKREDVTIRETEDSKAEIAVVGHVDEGLEKAIAESLPDPERKGFFEAVAKYRVETRDLLSPAERGETFAVPRLMAEVQGTLELADSDLFMEDHDWSLLDHSPKMGQGEFAVRETARGFEIDLDGRRVAYRFTTEAEQLALDVAVEGWTPEALVLWLDRQVRQPDIGQGELLRWLRDLVGHLIAARGLRIAALMRCKFILARKVREKIAAIRQQERDGVYQRCLFAPDARVGVSFDRAFAFRDGMYRDQRRYRGRWKPNKHFLGPDRVPAFDGAENGEEVQCAQAIDSLPGVRFWIRNAAGDPASFWLPTATGKFYPDFVARLNDDRLLVVEYKGAHIAESSDTAEKRTIGELWERNSGDKGLFIVVEKTVDGKDVRKQLMWKTGVA